MKLEQYFEARKQLAQMLEDPDYMEAIEDRLSSHRNSLCGYRYTHVSEDEYFVSLHNHSDSGCYTLQQMAETAAARGIKIMGITDHNFDIKFDGKVLKHYEFDGRGIFLIRGMECRCRTDNSCMKDVLLLGYENGVKPFKDFKETISLCKDKKGIVIATSAFNEGARGLSGQQLEEIVPSLDAIEIFNSCSGTGPLCVYDVLAEEFAEHRGITGIFANDAHTRREIGIAGFGVKKNDFKILENKNPREIVDNPYLLIDPLKEVLKKGAVNNYGSYVPKLSLIYPDKAVTLSHKHAVLRPG